MGIVKKPKGTKNNAKNSDKNSIKINIDAHYNEKPRLLKWTERNKSTIEFFVMIIGLGTLISYIWVSRDQSIKTQTAIEKSDSANLISKLSIDLSKESIDLSKRVFEYTKKSDSLNDVRIEEDAISREKNIRRELRAYIGIENFKIVQHDARGIQISYEILNTGKTPAYNLSTNDYFSFNPPDSASLASLSAESHQSFGRGIIGSGKPYTCYGVILSDFDEQAFAAFLQGRATLFFLNHVIYYDVFENMHFTQSCAICYRQPDSVFVIAGYAEFNEAD